jgi:uncharacterized protein (UPF0335 family)
MWPDKRRDESLIVQQLYESCMARENRLLNASHKKELHEAYKRLLFGTPLFWADRVGRDLPFDKAIGKSSAPFDFSVTRRKGEKSTSPEWRYNQLLKLLREEDDTELRWLLLGRWLKQEKICDPEEFLPKQILEGLIRRYYRAKKFSAADLTYWAAITQWKPYFERLESDLQEVRQKQGDVQAALKRMGYDAGAVNSTIEKRTTASRIMHWFAARRHVQIEKLQNAYSRMKRGSNEPLVSIL